MTKKSLIIVLYVFAVILLTSTPSHADTIPQPYAADNADGTHKLDVADNVSGNDDNGININNDTDTADSRITDILELFYFGSHYCGQCIEVKNTLLMPMERELTGKLKVHYHNTEVPESFELMVRLEKQFGVESGAPQELYFPDTVLLGYDAIMTYARAMIGERLHDPSRRLSIVVNEPAGDINEVLRDRFSQFAFWAIIAAALVDSINPCAIASLIFLLSFLAVQKKSRKDVLKIGLLFTATVFVTYLLLGIGFFKAIAFLDQYTWVSPFIKWSAVACAGIIGVVSLVDAFRFKKSGNLKDIKLQQSKSVKMRIHKVITKYLTGRRLIAGTITAGFLVTLLDAICTAEVYLPTIVLMTRSTDGELKLIGWFYLIIYNLIFVMPLIAVIIAAYHGLTWEKLSKMTQKNLTLLKILLGVVMLGLAAFLAWA